MANFGTFLVILCEKREKTMIKTKTNMKQTVFSILLLLALHYPWMAAAQGVQPVSVYPYYCGFEDSTVGRISEWQMVNGDQANRWCIGSAVNNGGSRSLYISNDNGATNTFDTSTSSTVYAICNLNFQEVGEYSISYDWRCGGPDIGDRQINYNWMRVFLVSASSDFTAGWLMPYGSANYNITHEPPQGWVDMTGIFEPPYCLTGLSTSWNTVNTSFHITNTGCYKLVFVWTNVGSAHYQLPAAVDNIAIEKLDCPSPINIETYGVTHNYIAVRWTPFGEENEWNIRVNDSLIENINTTNVILYNLEENTRYAIYLRAVCGSVDTSVWGRPLIVQTEVACPWPLSVTAVGSNGDSAFVSWTPDPTNSSTSYEVIYGPVGFNPDSSDESTVVYVNGNSSIELTGLAFGFYEAYVRCFCGENGYSRWTGPAFFGTHYINIDQADTISTCGAILCDIGGPSAGHGNSRTDQMVVFPEDNNHGLTFRGFVRTDGDWDYITIYEGVGTSGPIAYSDYLCGINSYRTIEPFDIEGPATIVIHAGCNGSYVNFEILVTCYELEDCRKPANFTCDSYDRADSVVVSWNEVGGATAWDLFIGPTGAQPTTGAAITVTDTVYTFTNLQGGEGYDIYVRSHCGNGRSGWRGPLNVIPVTYCLRPSGQDVISICAGVVCDNGGLRGHTECRGESILTVYPADNSSMLTFHGFSHIDDEYDYLIIYEGVGTGGNVLWNSTGSIYTENIPLDTCTTGPVTLQYYSSPHNLCGTEGFAIYFNCIAATDCSPVDNLAVQQTPTAALVTWDEGYYGTYNSATVEYKAADSSTWTALPAVTGTYAIITGLNANTEYNVRVTTSCGEGNSSYATINFRTLEFDCIVADTASMHNFIINGSEQSYGVPLQQNYGNSICQSIWLASELAMFGFDTTGSAPIPINSITYTWTNNELYSKQFSIYMTNTSESEFAGTNHNDWIPTGSDALVYTGRHEQNTSGSVTYELTPPFMWDGHSNICITTTMNQDNGNRHSYSGFYGYSSETSPTAYRSICMYQDNIPFNGADLSSIENNHRSIYRPSITLHSESCLLQNPCAAPAVQIMDVTSTTASLIWAPGNGESFWYVSYRLPDAANFSSPVLVSTNSYTLTDLHPGQRYEVRVEPLCSDGSIGASVFVYTLCDAIDSLPFTEDFNSWGSGMGVLPSCWYRTGSYDYYTYISNSQNHSGSQGGSVKMRQSSGSTPRSVLILPELDTSVYQVSQTQLIFSLIYCGPWYDPPIIEVGVVYDPEDASTFVLVDSVRSSVEGQWETFMVPLDTYSGNGANVVMRSTGAYCEEFFIDDVTLEFLPTCSRPDSLAYSNPTSSTVDLSWHDTDTPTQWEIEYGPGGFEQGTGTRLIVNSNPFTLTDLPTSYHGDFYVRAICGAGDTSHFSVGAPFHTGMCDDAAMATNYDPSMHDTVSEFTPIGYSPYRYSYVQTIIDSSCMEALGGDDVVSIAFETLSGTGGNRFENMTVFMANVPENDLGAGWIVPDASHVFVKVIDSVSFNYHGAGLHHFAFNTPFSWDGHSNVLVAVKRDDGTFDMTGLFRAHVHNATKVRFANSDSSPIDHTNIGNFFGFAFYSNVVGDITLISCGGTCNAPVVGSVATTPTSATITASGNGMLYELKYGTSHADILHTMTSTTGVFNITGLQPGTHYVYSVRQQCDSAVFSIWTGGAFVTEELPCSVPEDLHLIEASNSSVTLGWSASGNATSYALRVSGAGNDWYDTVSGTTATVTGLYANTLFVAIVRALCLPGVVESDWSEPIQFTTDECQPVQGITVGEITATSALISWASAPGSSGYTVEWGPEGWTNINDAAMAAVSVNSYNITDLEPDSPYDLFVINNCSPTQQSVNNQRVSFRTAHGQGIADIEGGSVTLAPNPASSRVSISLGGFGGVVKVELVDVNGRVRDKWSVTSGQLTVDLGGYAQGAYFVRVTGERQTAVRKLIVR